MSFLDKLKRRVDVLEDGQPQGEKKGVLQSTSNFAQLDVDIFETPNKYIIVGMIPGVDIKTLDISVGDENDVLIIQGKKASPIEQIKLTEKGLSHHHQECQWGDFYRQIILPQEVNPEMIEAYEERGVLIVNLPMLRLAKGKKNITITSKT
ncbi:MAG: Hsp20/alpha crystallin family protein [bacterium]